ncbi:MAG: chemotaxis protein CheW, partial [Pirellulaceae bacterium]|nr:chemotaxis protein CheW [Pirellulaceae bacterium]
LEICFIPELPLAGLKCQLLLNKLAAGDYTVLYTNPPAESVEDIETVKHFYIALAGIVDSQTLEAKLRVNGVDNIKVEHFQGSEEEKKSQTSVARPQESASSQGQTATQVTPATKVRQSEKAPAKKQDKNVPTLGKAAETLRVDIDRLDQLMNLAGQLVINKARFAQIGDGFKSSLQAKQAPHLLVSAENTVNRLLDRLAHGDQNQMDSFDIGLVEDSLQNLQQDFLSLKEEINQLYSFHRQVGELNDAVHQLDHITDGIQKSIMDTRMVPIGPLFSRFKRVIRDISRNNQKEIQLVINGEKTELDKRMIDELGDPLIHIVRNSADHGIESPDDREAVGKPRQGTVTLDAFHRGNNIIIQVTDDGGGLDKDKIVAKSIEKNIISPQDAERMTLHQIHQLVWEPGFSTAQSVTDISGRGMGMDIVRSCIENINGVVEIDSELGKGTVITIQLPLTMAILPSLMAEIDGDIFALPIESVSEIVHVTSESLNTVHEKTTATIRGRVLSVLKLSDVFKWNRPSKRQSQSVAKPGECTLVILGHDGTEIGLVVDHLLGEEDVVIKSMAENYKNIRGISGASILGNGSVSLILDVSALLEMASHKKHETATV